jgi:Ca2+-transporting ATPase
MDESGWWTVPDDAVFQRLRTTPAGLSNAEAALRLESTGPNRLQATPGVPTWRLLVRQLQSVVTALLVCAVIIALFMGDQLDAGAIAAVLVINTALGFVTELRATRAMESLFRLDTSQATVVRDGRALRIAARDIVPGDVVIVETEW